MAQVRLIDYLGFEVGEPDVPEPPPVVLIWGNEFGEFSLTCEGDDPRGERLPAFR